MGKKGNLDVYTDNTYRRKKLDTPYQDAYDSFLNYLLNQMDDAIEINVLASIALNDLEIGMQEGKDAQQIISKEYPKYIQRVQKGNRIKSEKEKIRNRDYEKYSVASIWQVFTVFIVLLFFRNWLNEEYLVNYSVDILIAIVAGIVAYRNVVMKARLIKKYQLGSIYTRLDILTIALCFVIKLVNRSNFDVTFFILVASYLITIRKIRKLFADIV